VNTIAPATARRQGDTPVKYSIAAEWTNPAGQTAAAPHWFTSLC
jgi:hypothetical protein